MITKNDRSQGEIFGVALMFVVIIIGVIVYGQIRSINYDIDTDTQKEKEYEILAEGTLNTVLGMSVECYVEKDRDTLKDLINFCLENEYAGNDPFMTCDNVEVRACEHAIDILNDSLLMLFNSSNALAIIPYKFKMDLSNSNSLLFNITLTNFGTYNYNGQEVNETNRRGFGFKRAPSGLISWSTAQRNIEFELYLYYR